MSNQSVSPRLADPHYYVDLTLQGLPDFSYHETTTEMWGSSFCFRTLERLPGILAVARRISI